MMILKMFQINRKNPKGFSLVEVLLAVSILSIGTIGILQAYAAAVEALNVSKENIDATCLLKNKMADMEQKELEQKGLFPEHNTDNFEGEFSDIVWDLQVSPACDNKLNEVQIEVFREEGTRKFSLVTYLSSPKIYEEN